MGAGEGPPAARPSVHPIRFIAIDPAYEVLAVEAQTAPDAAREAAIERLWREEQRRSEGRSDDGSVLAFVEADRRRLVGRLVRRRDVLAGRRAPELFGGRPPEPVQVGALISSQGRVLLGHCRGAGYACSGGWDLVASEPLDLAFRNPAGQGLDFQAALLARLVECAPLPRPARSALQPFALAHDREAGIWQVCVGLELDPRAQSPSEIEATQSRDFDAFRFVRPVDVIESGPDGSDELTPLAAALVRMPRAVPHVA